MRPVPWLGRGDWALVAALFVVIFSGTLISSNDYGITYDEPHYASAGSAYAAWWAKTLRSPGQALKRDAIEAAWRLNHEHPPLQKVASGLSSRWLGGALVGLSAARLPSALWFAMAVCALYLFTRRIWGRSGALFSALAFASMPRVVAHAHLLALDMPVTAWFFITAAVMAEALRRDSWIWAVGAGAAFGAALLSKMNAFFLPILLLPWGLIWHRRRWPKLVVPVAAIGPAVFLLGWPWLWVDTVVHLREYVSFHFRHAAYNVWYLGRLYRYAPWHYPFVITAVTTPTLLLVAALGGIPRCWPRRGVDPDRVLLLVGLAVTLLPGALPTSPKYNGVRLFLPAFPFLAALAGGGYDWLQARAGALSGVQRQLGPRARVLVPALVGVLLLMPGFRSVEQTHPYQLAYYNALAGGTGGATRRGFETIYWGQVFSEAAGFVNAIDRPSPRLLVIPKGVIYLFELAGVRRDAWFTADEGEAAEVDYVVFQCMQSDFTDLCWRLYEEARPTYAVMLGETPLLVAYDRAAISRALAEPATRASARSERKSPTRKLAGS